MTTKIMKCIAVVALLVSAAWSASSVSAIAVMTQAARVNDAAYQWTDLACFIAFCASLLFLKNQPLLSTASITDRTPGSESL